MDSSHEVERVFKGAGFLSHDLINILREVIMPGLLETGVMSDSV